MNFRNLMENKMFKTLMIGVVLLVVIILIVVVVFMFKGGSNGRLDNFPAVEAKLVNAAKDYFANYSSKLPLEVGSTTEVSVTALSDEDYIDPLSEIVPENAVCDGKVVVKNVNNNYFYQAYLDCGNSYKTEALYSYILTRSTLATGEEGLYQNADGYYYRGEDPNNYITFSGETYRILRINNDGTMDIIATAKRERTVWDDRYNQDRNGNDGINNFSVSRVKEYLQNFINSESFSDIDRLMLEPHLLCVGKVGEDAYVQLGQECVSTVPNQIIGLLPLSYYMYASLDSLCTTPLSGNCQNYNYLTAYSSSWWTLTGDAANTHRVYTISSGSTASTSRASSNASLREVLRLTNQVVYVSGDGSASNPYVMK